MRIVLTADLHFNHPRSRPLVPGIIDQINRAGGDVLVVIGDTADFDGDDLEACLNQFQFSGPKLFIAGNHELWTTGDDSYAIYTDLLPRRVRNLGWHWLDTEPFRAGDLAIIGSVGWYDYTFAQASLEIPQRFYRAKVSPGAIRHLAEFSNLLKGASDVTPHAMEVIARWNDGRYVKLHKSDEEFVAELIAQMDRQLQAVADAKKVIAAIHHLPFRELLPPPHSFQWDFAKAYLGAGIFGRTLLKYPNVTHAYCGHSHFPAEATIRHIKAINIGSSYREKTFKVLDI